MGEGGVEQAGLIRVWRMEQPSEFAEAFGKEHQTMNGFKCLTKYQLVTLR
jgi:hypothetical protein